MSLQSFLLSCSSLNNKSILQCKVSVEQTNAIADSDSDDENGEVLRS